MSEALKQLALAETSLRQAANSMVYERDSALIELAINAVVVARRLAVFASTPSQGWRRLE